MKKYLFFFCSFLFLHGAQSEFAFENTNYILHSKSALDDKPYMYDFNRFRITNDWSFDEVRFKIIADNENIISNEFLKTKEFDSLSTYEPDLPFETNSEFAGDDNLQNRFKLHRAYGEYFSQKHAITFGLFNTPFGVGRIWTPVDVFSPLNSLSLEVDEREGNFGAKYEYAINDLSALQVVISQTKEAKTKKAIRAKGYLDFADFAVLAVETNLFKMAGYEFDSEILDTSIGFRSEGGIFEDKATQNSYNKYILGVDYGFENSFFTLEYLHSQINQYTNIKEDSSYLGLHASFTPSMLWNLNFLAIRNLDDESFVFYPSAVYSLSDEETLSFGLTTSSGEEDSDFGALKPLYFAKWDINF